MRVDSNTRTGELAGGGRPGKSSPAPTSEVVGRAEAGGDETRLSLDHARIRSFEAEVAALPEVRRERVESLRQLVRNGSYQTEPEKIADSMFADWAARSGLIRR